MTSRRRTRQLLHPPRQPIIDLIQHLRRHAEPAEVATSVAWLASDQNTYITGHILGVDGGLSVTF